jgi:nucleotide-binding universal stress UspA family protein
MQFQHILIPTDFSGTAEPAVHHALALAAREQAQVLLLHVLPGMAVVEAEDRAQATAEEWLQEVVRQAPGPVEVLVVRGTPAAEICRVARERHIDLIAMSTHGRTGRARDLLGSVANEVIRQAPCAVLVFRAALFDPPAGEAGDPV